MIKIIKIVLFIISFFIYSYFYINNGISARNSGFLFIILFFIINFDSIVSKNILSFFKRLFLKILFFLMILLTIFSFYKLENYIEKHEKIIDLTKDKTHTLSINTINLLKNLPGKIKILVFKQGIIPQYLKDLLESFQKKANNRLEYSFHDPLIDIAIAARYQKKVDINGEYIYIQYQKNVIMIDFKDKDVTEFQLAEAIKSATKLNKTAYFIQGHSENRIDDDSETGISTFAKVLKDANFELKELTLASIESIPDDCDLLVIAGPKSNFMTKENEIILNYLDDGGNLLVFIQSVNLSLDKSGKIKKDLNKSPNLNEILNVWGINVNDDIVIDKLAHLGQDIGCPAVNKYPKHDHIVNDLGMTIYIRPRSITLFNPKNDNFNKLLRAPLVQTLSDQSWGEKDLLKVKYDEGIDVKAPVNIAVITFGPKYRTTDKGEIARKHGNPKIVVFGDSDFITNKWAFTYQNLNIAVNSAAWLSDNKEFVISKKNSNKFKRIVLTNKQIRIITVILMIFPILLIILMFNVIKR